MYRLGISIFIIALLLKANTVLAYEDCEACHTDHQSICREECREQPRTCHDKCLASKCMTYCEKKGESKNSPTPAAQTPPPVK